MNIHQEPKNIAELMFNSDLVITSPGMSMFEAILVEHQLFQYAKILYKNKATIHLIMNSYYTN